MKDTCRTRWIERVDAYIVFFSLYPAILTTLQSMTTHNTDFGEWSWDAETTAKANGFLHHITSTSFFIAAKILLHCLSLLRGITVKLQRKSTDVLQAYNQLVEVHNELHLLRQNVVEEFSSIFQEMEEEAKLLDILFSLPRLAPCQRHRTNISSDSIEEYYRRAVMVPFLDHILRELDERFSEMHRKVVQIFTLLPSNLPISSTCSSEVTGPLRSLVDIYQHDLPSPSSFSVEYSSWVRHWRVQHTAEITPPDNLQDAYKQCDAECYPNIHVLLKLLLTLPVTTCENERSHSQLKLVKTHLRTTMSEERLSALMLLKVHRIAAKNLSISRLVDQFVLKYPRRMLLKCLLLD
jgi:hypothetical protein